MLTNWFAFLLHKFLKVSTSSDTRNMRWYLCVFGKQMCPYSFHFKLNMWLQKFFTLVDFCVFSVKFSHVRICVSVCPCVRAGVCWGASVYAVLRHQAADGKGAHRRHHWRGPLFPEWRQAHPPADWVQNPGTSHSMRHTRSLHRSSLRHTNVDPKQYSLFAAKPDTKNPHSFFAIVDGQGILQHVRNPVC